MKRFKSMTSFGSHVGIVIVSVVMILIQSLVFKGVESDVVHWQDIKCTIEKSVKRDLVLDCNGETVNGISDLKIALYATMNMRNEKPYFVCKKVSGSIFTDTETKCRVKS